MCHQHAQASSYKRGDTEEQTCFRGGGWILQTNVGFLIWKLHTLKSWHSHTQKYSQIPRQMRTHTAKWVVITCACDSPAARHAVFQYAGPLKRQQQPFTAPWKTDRELCAASYVLHIFSTCVRVFVYIKDLLSVCTFASKSLRASYLEISPLALHPCRHDFTPSAAEGSYTSISLAALWWLTLSWPKERVLSIYYQLYSTPTLWLRGRSESKTVRDRNSDGESGWKICDGWTIIYCQLVVREKWRLTKEH